MPIAWLVRHGESLSNKGDMTCCSKETELTETGHVQAQEIVQAFSSNVPSLIITSKYTRSQQTASPTMRAFPQARQERWQVHEFTYLSEKKTFCTTRQERRQFVQHFWDKDDPWYFDGPGAESFAEFIKRVYETIECLRYNKEVFTAVFTHGQFIQAMLWILETNSSQLDTDSKAAFRRFCYEHPIPTGGIQEIEFCGREEIRLGRLLTDHLSVINSHESRDEENSASPALNTTITR